MKSHKHKVTSFAVIAILMCGSMLAVFGAHEQPTDTSFQSNEYDDLLGSPAPTISAKKNFGGSGNDIFYKVVAMPPSYGSFVAIGYSVAASFGTGDWTGVTGRGSTDAIIAHIAPNGNILWKKNFGGSGHDHFESVTIKITNGSAAVGLSEATSFGNGDWTGVTGNGNYDAIIVNFADNGGVIWKKNFGGSGNDRFFDIIATSDAGFVAVGRSDAASFGNGDWTGVTGRGGEDAIIVKFDFDGNVIWKKNFGGSGNDIFNAVTRTSDGGFVAVGNSSPASFGNGDWVGVTGRGSNDAIIVKFDADGNIVWKKNFGGSDGDMFFAVTRTSDGGFVAAGYSFAASFGTGDWTGVTGRGSDDAIIVKFDASGNVAWNKNFGGSGKDGFYGVTETSGGVFVAVGDSAAASFGNGDWVGVTGHGNYDAVTVMFDASGNVVWKNNFGGAGTDLVEGIAARSDGSFAVVGNSQAESFGNGDWTGVTGQGNQDAIFIMVTVALEITSKNEDVTIGIGQPLNSSVTTNIPSTISISGAPWAYLDPNNVIRGTPDSVGTWTITITAKYGDKTVTHSFIVTVSNAPSANITVTYGGTGRTIHLDATNSVGTIKWIIDGTIINDEYDLPWTFLTSGLKTISATLTVGLQTALWSEDILIIDASAPTTAQFNKMYSYTFLIPTSTVGSVSLGMTPGIWLSHSTGTINATTSWVTVTGVPSLSSMVGKTYDVSVIYGTQVKAWPVTVEGGDGWPEAGFTWRVINGLTVEITSTATNAPDLFYTMFVGGPNNAKPSVFSYTYDESFIGQTVIVTQTARNPVMGPDFVSTYSAYVPLTAPGTGNEKEDQDETQGNDLYMVATAVVFAAFIISAIAAALGARNPMVLLFAALTLPIAVILAWLGLG